MKDLKDQPLGWPVVHTQRELDELAAQQAQLLAADPHADLGGLGEGDEDEDEDGEFSDDDPMEGDEG